MADPVVLVAVDPPLPVVVAAPPEVDDVSVPLVEASLVLADVLVTELVVLPPVVTAAVFAVAVL